MKRSYYPTSVSQIQKKPETSFFDHNRSEKQPFFAGKEGTGNGFFNASAPLSTRPTIQAKLSIGQPNDKYEQEADTMADKVVQRFSQSGTIQRSTPPVEEEKIQKMDAEKRPEEAPELQKSAVSPVGEEDKMQMKCMDCEEKDKPVQRKASGETTASPSIESKLSSTKGSGSPLENDTRNGMESAFGADFSNVRVHTGSEAVQMSQDLNAHAFTHGSDVYFNSGKYNPSTTEGGRLLAHELTHTVQQNTGIQKKAVPQIQLGAKEEAAKANLIAIYHLKGVNEGDATWTEEELILVSEAFKMLPPADKKVLVGVVLIRNQNIGGVASSTAGEFGSEQGVQGTAVRNDASITLSNLAFKDTQKDESRRVIIHEVGHAVASLRRRTVSHEAYEAVAHSNEKIDEFNTALDLSNPAIDAFNAKNKERNALVIAYNPIKETPQGRALLPQIVALDAQLVPLREEKDRLKQVTATKEASSNTAQEAADSKKIAAAATMIAPADAQKVAYQADASQAAFNHLPKVLPATITDADKAQGAAYIAAVNKSGTDIAAFHTATKTQKLKTDDVDALITPIKQQINIRKTEKTNVAAVKATNGLLGFFTPIEMAQDAYFETAKAQALAHTRSAQVQKFVDFVVLNKIDPTITTYAADNWPYKPEEFYAEAYSFFVTKKLEAWNPVLNKWFTDSNYKN